MTVGELIKELHKYEHDSQIMILDSFNGAGTPREINVGPKYQMVTEYDSRRAADCEGLIGQDVVVIGYGCY